MNIQFVELKDIEDPVSWLGDNDFKIANWIDLKEVGGSQSDCSGDSFSVACESNGVSRIQKQAPFRGAAYIEYYFIDTRHGKLLWLEGDG